MYFFRGKDAWKEDEDEWVGRIRNDFYAQVKTVLEPTNEKVHNADVLKPSRAETSPEVFAEETDPGVEAGSPGHLDVGDTAACCGMEALMLRGVGTTERNAEVWMRHGCRSLVLMKERGSLLDKAELEVLLCVTEIEGRKSLNVKRL
ncbi:hypothetical protein XENOCAPTIV_008490 [Xenoophorus captivus]|uniref:Uncharacterized protein n=1 Tax=Xenoophorus captivus TaxID=1517983 RepID=A0ABV0QID0_9TELE